jgi:glutamate dehydrogenase
MKAQTVKNAVIVPVGAKGGFFVKRPPETGGRDALLAEGVACYQTFIRGLLDLTDNIVGGEIVAPAGVVRHDGDDPYLVVAADKGTATFSDIANAISQESGFWLGDAFASGGSTGYDHKKMGITARGAWESVGRHFRELGHNVAEQDFTVVGVGDMSGDVFGNGMLLSRHIRLIAAFNHRDIFIDPNPDPEASFDERQRLFGLPRSSWADYDRERISAGGGVHARTAKSIALTAEARAALGTDAQELAPNELIRAILRAPADLLWNGGIGTYVKAASETHADAGDKTNDAVRVDAGELRCRVVGEGGNLGLTQRARIEYGLGHGWVNTDAIDNSAGVDCSDHEVNIKILLDAVVDAGDLTEKQRNELLVSMTDDVAELVLTDNYEQGETLSLAEAQAASMLDVHARFIRSLERARRLDRELEALPSDQVIAERKVAGSGLTRPELAVLIAYSKLELHDALVDSDVPEDPHLSGLLERYFPDVLSQRFKQQMREHRLRREVIATQVVNSMLHGGGATFAFRLHEELGAAAPETDRAYAVARDVFEMRPCGRRSRTSTTASTPARRPACCSRDGRSSSAPRAGCCATVAGRSRSRPRCSSSRPVQRGCTGRFRRCSPRRRPRSSRGTWPRCRRPACQARSRSARPAWARCSRRWTSSRWLVRARSTSRRSRRSTSVSVRDWRSTGCAHASTSSRATTAGACSRARRCART